MYNKFLIARNLKNPDSLCTFTVSWAFASLLLNCRWRAQYSFCCILDILSSGDWLECYWHHNIQLLTFYCLWVLSKCSQLLSQCLTNQPAVCVVSSGGAMQNIHLQILWKVHFHSLCMRKQIPIQWRYVTLNSFDKCVQKVTKYGYLCSCSTIIIVRHMCGVKSLPCTRFLFIFAIIYLFRLIEWGIGTHFSAIV